MNVHSIQQTIHQALPGPLLWIIAATVATVMWTSCAPRNAEAPAIGPEVDEVRSNVMTCDDENYCPELSYCDERGQCVRTNACHSDVDCGSGERCSMGRCSIVSLPDADTITTRHSTL